MASSLLVKDMLEAQDAGFLPAFLALGAAPDAQGKHDEAAALSLLKSWLADPRPWARAQLFAYVDDGCARPGHRRFVRGLLRHAEGSARAPGDDELLGALCAAFDRMLPSTVVTRTRWDWSSREQVKRRVRRLVVRVPHRARRVQWKWTREGRQKTGAVTEVYTQGRFSVVTRRYLQRRAARALRGLAKEPARYVRAAASLLSRSSAARLAEPAGLLDARILCMVLYRESDVLDVKPHRVDVKPGKRVADLQLAPLAPHAWAAHGTDALLALVSEAPAALVRRFAAQQLQKVLPELPIARLRALFRSPYDEARAAALMLLSVSDTANVDAKAWIALLDVEDPALASSLAARAAEVLAAAQLDAPTLVQLCRARAAPVALLAARLLLARLGDIGVRAALPALDAEVPSARAQLLEAFAPLLARSGDALLVRDLLDSAYPDVRACGASLMRVHAEFQDAPALWTALTESPFADLRAALLEHLEARRDALPPDAVLAVCAAALLDCLRGSRQRPRALALAAARLADAAEQDPNEAARALPLLSFALRSVRAADRRAALAVIVRTAWQRPQARALFATLPGVSVPDPARIEVQA